MAKHPTETAVITAERIKVKRYIVIGREHVWLRISMSI